jgi:hypothetical protein
MAVAMDPLAGWDINHERSASDREKTGREAGPPVPAVPPPTHIGRCRIERVLGRGGFGVVYLAHDDQLQRLVAVKVPHPQRVDRPEDTEAYLRRRPLRWRLTLARIRRPTPCAGSLRARWTIGRPR